MGSIQTQEQGQDGLVRELREAKRQALILGQLTGDRGPAPGVPTERRAAKNRRRENSFHAFLYGNSVRAGAVAAAPMITTDLSSTGTSRMSCTRRWQSSC